MTFTIQRLTIAIVLAAGIVTMPWLTPVRGQVSTGSTVKDGQRITGKVKLLSAYLVAFEDRMDFRLVRFENNRLVVEFAIEGWRPGDGPLSVESGQQVNKGMVRMEATLQGDKLIGKWGQFTGDGTEVFRGEWDASRVPAPPSVGWDESASPTDTSSRKRPAAN